MAHTRTPWFFAYKCYLSRGVKRASPPRLMADWQERKNEASGPASPTLTRQSPGLNGLGGFLLFMQS
ncbi:hypothetical protein PIB30_071479 [Stylosanthes scabra]|uniref:Uncharacterized protein n=1 Tax=Stylosanthes scabra TaxID=79078 RepID=A0ABU6XLY9_9FABA|nr:hypothetical protein [Stylosanthes scabra]